MQNSREISKLDWLVLGIIIIIVYLGSGVAKCFMNVISLSPWRVLPTTLLFPFGRLGNGSTEELSYLSKGTELIPESRQTDIKLCLPRLSMRSRQLCPHRGVTSTQSFGVP